MIRTKKSPCIVLGLISWFKWATESVQELFRKASKISAAKGAQSVNRFCGSGDGKMVESRLVRFVEGTTRSVDLSYVKWRGN